MKISNRSALITYIYEYVLYTLEIFSSLMEPLHTYEDSIIFPIFRDSYDVSIDRPRERKYEIWKEAYFSKRFCFIHLIYVVFKIPDHEIPWVFFSNNLHDKDNEID